METTVEGLSQKEIDVLRNISPDFDIVVNRKKKPFLEFVAPIVKMGDKRIIWIPVSIRKMLGDADVGRETKYKITIEKVF